MEKSEKIWLCTYIFNFLNSRKVVEEKLPKFVEWYQEYGGKKILFNFEWMTNKEKEEFSDDFDDLYKEHKRQMLCRADEFKDKLFTFIKKHRCETKSSLEIKVKSISDLLKLDAEEESILVALLRFKTLKDFECLSDELAGIKEEIIDILPYFLGISENKLYKYLNESSKLAKFGLIKKEYNFNIGLTDITEKLINSKIKTISDIKECLIGNTLKANLEWNDFDYIEEK